MEELLELLDRPARPLALAACGLLTLGALQSARLVLREKAKAAESANEAVRENLEEAQAALDDVGVESARRRSALDKFRAGLPKLAEDRRQIYESGLQLQEEKRLLEKQLEIVTTHILVDEAARQVHVMRGDQALETYSIGFAAPRSRGGAKAPPAESPVISKERFAHPERPKTEQVAGQLQWEPPQAGTSARVNALGEYVVFTRGSLILHGPPAKEAEHELYAHTCLELTLPVARRLYQASFIGTKVGLKAAAVARKK